MRRAGPGGLHFQNVVRGRDGAIMSIEVWLRVPASKPARGSMRATRPVSMIWSRSSDRHARRPVHAAWPCRPRSAGPGPEPARHGPSAQHHDDQRPSHHQPAEPSPANLPLALDYTGSLRENHQRPNEQCSRQPRRARHPSSDLLSRPPAGHILPIGLQPIPGPQVLTRQRLPESESALAPLTR